MELSAIMELAVIGVGYVGLVTGACLAEKGHRITCLDIDQEKIACLRNQKIPFFEPGLEELVHKNAAAGRLFFTTDYREALGRASVCFIAVPTPCAQDGSCDLRYVLKAAQRAAEVMEKPTLFVIKSTVPPGTTARVHACICDTLEREKKNIAFDVVSNPEFLKEGSAVKDCLYPDRIIVGVSNDKAKATMQKIYAGFEGHKQLFMDPASAELTKYAANAMLASRISFMNEISLLCEKTGADVRAVREGIGSDARIGPQFLNHGPAYGGSCFPKDVQALCTLSESLDLPAYMLNAIEAANCHQKKVVGGKLRKHFEAQGGLAGKTVGVWGLSFKPNTDDIRESPSLELIRELLASSTKLRLYDPAAMDQAKKFFGDHPAITWCRNAYDAADHADAIVLMTEWEEFLSLDFELLSSLVRQRSLFDGRNQYEPLEIASKGFHYSGIGIPQPQEELCSLSKASFSLIP